MFFLFFVLNFLLFAVSVLSTLLTKIKGNYIRFIYYNFYKNLVLTTPNLRFAEYLRSISEHERDSFRDTAEMRIPVFLFGVIR